MPTLIFDLNLQQRLKAERAAVGADRYDEVWEGTYVMAPMPNDEHQQLVSRLTSIFQEVIDWPGRGDVRPGVNVSDRIDGWEQNYRVPDVAVFLREGQAENHGGFCFGGPDFVVEITSPSDHTRDKLPFYQQVGVRELLVVEREPWTLELFRREQAGFDQVARLEPGSEAITSAVFPFTFQLVSDQPRPRIRVTCTETGQIWPV